jgi:hypothetical protein
MAYKAYICRIRTDMDSAGLQITDLKPNTSQRSLIYEPVGQSGYVGSRVTNETVGALATNATTAEYAGLAAYLIDNVINATGTVTVTVTIANAAAQDIIDILDAGTDLGATEINAALVTGGAGAGTTINTGGSTGSVIEVLQILSGRTYTLPSGSTVGALTAGAQLGSFSSLATDGMRELYLTGALQVSCGDGVLSKLALTAYSYGGTTGAALAVYDYQGTALTSTT